MRSACLPPPCTLKQLLLTVPGLQHLLLVADFAGVQTDTHFIIHRLRGGGALPLWRDVQLVVRYFVVYVLELLRQGSDLGVGVGIASKMGGQHDLNGRQENTRHQQLASFLRCPSLVIGNRREKGGEGTARAWRRSPPEQAHAP